MAQLNRHDYNSIEKLRDIVNRIFHKSLCRTRINKQRKRKYSEINK